jgi:hypothetical protein
VDGRARVVVRLDDVAATSQNGECEAGKGGPEVNTDNDFGRNLLKRVSLLINDDEEPEKEDEEEGGPCLLIRKSHRNQEKWS